MNDFLWTVNYFEMTYTLWNSCSVPTLLFETIFLKTSLFFMVDMSTSYLFFQMSV